MELLFLFLSVSAAAACFVLGTMVLLKNIKSNVNYNFFVFTWFITVWALVSYAFFMDQSNFFVYKLAYALGGATILSSAPWILYLTKERVSKYLVAFFYLLAGLLVSVPFWDQSAITNFVNKNGFYDFDLGVSFYIYSAVVFLSLVYLLILLIKKCLASKEIQRYKILFVLIGLSLYFFGELLFGVILPLLRVTPSAPLDNLAAISFVGFASYALLKLDREE